MVTIESSIRRGFLRSLHRNGKAQAVTLIEALEAFQSGGFTAVKTGRIVVSTSGSGRSTAFEIPGVARRFTQDSIFALSEDLIQIYQDTCTALNISAEDQASGARDDDVIAGMLNDDRMQSIRAVQMDSTALRYPSYGPRA